MYHVHPETSVLSSAVSDVLSLLYLLDICCISHSHLANTMWVSTHTPMLFIMMVMMRWTTMITTSLFINYSTWYLYIASPKSTACWHYATKARLLWCRRQKPCAFVWLCNQATHYQRVHVQFSVQHCYVWTSLYFTDTLDCLVSFLPTPPHRSPCMIQSGTVSLYDTIWYHFLARCDLLAILVQYQSRSHSYYDT